jgi:hypothetical protein
MRALDSSSDGHAALSSSLEPESDRYGRVPPGFLCGRCNTPLSTKWDGKCERCGARYIEFTPQASKNVPDPFGDSQALRRFQASCLVLTVALGIGGVVILLGGGVALAAPVVLLGVAFGLVRLSRTRP